MNNYQKIIDKFPCLESIFDKIEQIKTFTYLSFIGEGYYDSLEEFFLYELWVRCHEKLDTTLPPNIEKWDQYIIHDELDFILHQHDLLYSLDEEGRYMWDYHDYPEEGNVKLYEELQKISPFRSVPYPPLIKGEDLFL